MVSQLSEGLNPLYTARAHTHTHTQTRTQTHVHTSTRAHSTAWRQQNQYCSLSVCVGIGGWVSVIGRKKKIVLFVPLCVCVCVSWHISILRSLYLEDLLLFSITGSGLRDGQLYSKQKKATEQNFVFW